MLPLNFWFPASRPPKSQWSILSLHSNYLSRLASQVQHLALFSPLALRLLVARFFGYLQALKSIRAPIHCPASHLPAPSAFKLIIELLAVIVYISLRLSVQIIVNLVEHLRMAVLTAVRSELQGIIEGGSFLHCCSSCLFSYFPFFFSFNLNYYIFQIIRA